MEPAVFLDRDNTLIANDGDLGDPAAVRLVDGVAGGLTALREAGYRLIVVTNQGGVARGKFNESDVDAVHQRIATLIDEAAGRHGVIDRFYYCPYHPEATVEEYRRDHPWRKPHPGMLLQAARDLGLDLAHSWMIGDQQRDVLAGRASGCRTILVHPDTANAATKAARPTASVRAFAEAVQVILQDASHPGAGGGHVPGNHQHGEPAERNGSVASGDSGASARAGNGSKELGSLRRAVLDLAEEMRSSRVRRSEFTALRMACGVCQLLTVLLAVLGIMHLNAADSFYKWMMAAVLSQLLTIAMLLLDNRG